MNWITKEQATEAAKQGLIPSLECSLKHHQQGRDADYVELDLAIGKEFDVTQQHCACCQLANIKENDIPWKPQNCKRCVLGDGKHGSSGCCQGKWNRADSCLGRLSYRTNASFAAFQKAEAEVCDYIEKILEQERAKVIKHNFEDDLKRNKEDLDDFKVKGVTGSSYVRVQASYTDRGEIDIYINRNNKVAMGSFTLDQATEIHQKLGQIIATVKRKEVKNAKCK